MFAAAWKIFLLSLAFLLPPAFGFAEDGYRLWLRYNKINDPQHLQQYQQLISSFFIESTTPTQLVARQELIIGLKGLLGKTIAEAKSSKNASLLIFSKSSQYTAFVTGINYTSLGTEGFTIQTRKSDRKNSIIITANSDAGILYGVFHFLRLIQTGQNLQHLNISTAPKIRLRLLNHWDNLNRYVERGYAGISIWNWHTLPDYIDPRYKDYARANASIGINGASVTNVNANAVVLTKPYLEKCAALAKVFRIYGIKLYLTARFSAPI